MVMFLRSALRAKRFYLSLTGAVLAGGGAYAILNDLRLKGEIGWTETIIGTLAAYFIVKRTIAFIWNRGDLFIRRQFRYAKENFKRNNIK